VGCGGGLFLLHLSQRLPAMRLVGTDISPDAIVIANNTLAAWREKNLNLHVSFQLQAQPSLLLPENSFDVVMSTLVCHHLSDDALIDFLQKSYRVARVAVVINDLHRHSLAEFFYRIVSPFFRNRLITHDGLISIRRGFTRADWVLLLQKANITHYRIQWLFPFRWRVVLWKE
jgi:SAM-dependent methyltransferase